MLITIVVVAVIIILIFLLKGNINNQDQTRIPRNYAEQRDTIIIGNPQKIEADITIEGSATEIGEYLVLDIETTGFAKSSAGSIQDSQNWPYILQIAWFLVDKDFKHVDSQNHYVKYLGPIDAGAQRVHHITTKMLAEKGKHIRDVIEELLKALNNTKYIVAHNVSFDIPIVMAELYRNGHTGIIEKFPTICTMSTSISYVGSTAKNGSIKNPRLEELYARCYYPNELYVSIPGMHDAEMDALLTVKCLQHLVENKIIESNGAQVRKQYGNRIEKKITFDNSLPIRERHRPPIDFDYHDVISGDVLKMDKQNAISEDNIFWGKKVVITGLFDSWPNRMEIATRLQKLGADVDTSVGLKTNILIAGADAGFRKIEKMQLNIDAGRDARFMNEKELNDILKEYNLYLPEL